MAPVPSKLRPPDRPVLVHFIATADPPAAHANDKNYKGTWLTGAEKREFARRISKKPIPLPKEHGRAASEGREIGRAHV